MKPIAKTLIEQISLLDVNKPVQVYRNLHRGMFSVKQGVVRFHTNLIALRGGCEFVVKEKGRLRVLAEKQKNVHGFVKGYINTRSIHRIAKLIESGNTGLINRFFGKVYYNPYTCEQFMCDDSPIFKSNGVILIMIENSAKIYSIKKRK